MHWKEISLFYSAAFYGITTALTANVTDVVTGAYIIEFADDYVSIYITEGEIVL